MTQQQRLWIALTASAAIVGGVFAAAYTVGKVCKDGSLRFSCERVDRQWDRLR